MKFPFRPLIPILAAALLLLAGCGPDRPGLSAENDDPSYREGLQFKREGRFDEALAAYLKVIARRGEEQAPESHLEVGLIYLEHVKDPIAAIYHFRKYLELEPNSRQSAQVQGLIDTAKREFARTLPGHPLDGLSGLPGSELDSLRQENQELKSELSALQAGAVPLAARTTPPPSRSDSLFIAPPPAAAPQPVDSAPAELVPEAPAALVPAQAAAPPPLQAPAPAAQAAGRPAGRTHTVAKGDTLFSLAKRYYGAASTAKARAIYEANRGVMRSETDLRPGMELKIP